MILNSNFPIPHRKSPSPPHQNLPILQRITPFQAHHRRTWRRRRLKPKRTTTLLVRAQLNPSPLFENLFQNLLSQFPSVNSLDVIAPSLGFASGVVLYLSRLNNNSTTNNNPPDSEIGDWILFASPTPFNRFVMLRCPSISFEGSDLLGDVNDRLVKEESHFVKLNSGKFIQVRDRDDDDVSLSEKMVYQRVCVSADDGGVISLDWPANLDLNGERGLDTTVLLVPGTAEGSMDRNVRSFVCESLKRGYFPVVMNPRGCSGSPLTTPRLFTAADSNDICIAIQFINRARPWTTLMGVGWGFGANMLTKYLAEVGEKTPLTAATCIDNPFDLEEATRSSPYHIALDQKLTGGLVDILRSNKELFRGKAKGFDVEKALVANSVRDFEKSISMISYGFEDLEDFYAKSSTRNVVGKVKIPVLFIQSDDAVVPLFSIPRSLIAENPFTSLLLCSCLPSSVIASGRCAISWSHHLTIQWLAAVELGLLKGRHPLLEDVDVTINPSKGLTLLESRASDKSSKANKLLNLSPSNVVNGYAGYPLKEKLEEWDTPAGFGSRFRQDQQRNPEIEDKGLQREGIDASKQTGPVDAESANEEVRPVDVESSHVLQTTQMVMNMLDVTMPGTLTEEQKKKVLSAVGQGKTVMVALQDAVPEDVRAKLTNAVSGILHNRETNVKLEGLSTKIQEKVGEVSSGGGHEEPRSSGVDDLANDNDVPFDKTAVGLEPELQASDMLQNPIDTVQDQPMENMDISRERTAEYAGYSENGSDTGAQPDFPSQPESTSSIEDSTSDENKMDQSYTASFAEAQPTESVGNDHLKREEKSINSILDQSSSDSQTPSGFGSRFRQDQQRNPEIEDKGLQRESIDTSKQTGPVDAESANEEVRPVDVESSHVLQTTQMVMNMLDVTMPGTLTEEQKKKVLSAVGQGKTVMEALQDAVPEDVRAKLTNAVSGILHNQETNVKLEGLSTKIQEKVGEVSSGGGHEEPRSSGVDDLANGNDVPFGKTAVGLEPELQASDTLQNPIDTVQDQPMDNMDISRERTAEYAGYSENGSDTGAQPDFPSQPESTSSIEDSTSDENKMDQSYTASSAEAQPTESVGNDHLKREEKSINSILDQSSSDSQTFGVSQALDAFAGMDDSTQVAVNSVFGVLEDMITQLDNKTEVDDKNKVMAEGTGSITENPQFAKEYSGSARKEKTGSDLRSQSDMLDNETTEFLASSKPLSEQSNKVRHLRTIPLFLTGSTDDPFYKENLRKYLLSKVQNAESLDLDRTTALFLEYIPEKGQWKLLEQPESNEGSGADITTLEGVKEVTQAHSPSKADTNLFIEESYVIMDTEQQQEPVREYIREYNAENKTNDGLAIRNDTSESIVKNVILDSLKVEVGRRLSAENMNEMEPSLSEDIEHFANAVSLTAGRSKTQIWFLDGEDCNLGKLGTLNGEELLRAMSFAIQETSYLRSVLPYGVVMGSCLAALRKFFDVAAVDGIDQREAMALDQINPSVERNHVQLLETEADRVLLNKLDHKYTESKSTDGEKTYLKKVGNRTIMAGAATAALGASAMLVHQRDSDKGNSTSGTLACSSEEKENHHEDSDKGNSTSGTLASSSEEKENHHEEPDKLEPEISEKSDNNVVTSLAEKAVSVAGPVVPVKEDGEVDQDRLVALLSGLGKQGGMLKLFGKVALLWGGIRGAMSLTDRLIVFLRLAERPLLQRILGFVCMVLVLWSPVVVPLLPTLMQSWASHNSCKFAELVCIIGLYSSITMLVMLWGKRIRGYENPFEQYGLDLTSSSKIQNFLKGLVGGVVVDLSIHSLNALLGCVGLSPPSTFISYSSDIVTLIKVYGKMLLLIAQGLVTATGVALVEELIFRAWLPDEIATDLGYYRGIIISGLAFSLLQRSPWAIPSLWLLSLGLAGARQRSGGSLSIPIGLRAGIMASNFVLQTGGFLTSKPNLSMWGGLLTSKSHFPMWVTGSNPLQPFSGISGLAFSLLLAMVLHPKERNPSEEKHKDNS